MTKFWRVLFFVQLAILASVLFSYQYYSAAPITWRVPTLFLASTFVIIVFIGFLRFLDFVLDTSVGEAALDFFFDHWWECLNLLLGIFGWWFLNFGMHIQLASNGNLQALIPVITFPTWIVVILFLGPKNEASL